MNIREHLDNNKRVFKHSERRLVQVRGRIPTTEVQILPPFQIINQYLRLNLELRLSHSRTTERWLLRVSNVDRRDKKG